MLMKQQFQFPCLGPTLKVCIVFMFVTYATSLACWGGGGGNWKQDEENIDDYWEEYLNFTVNRTFFVVALDPTPAVNLTDITNTADRNIKSAWRGWEPNEDTQAEWKAWHKKWREENQEGPGSKKKKGTGEDDDDEDPEEFDEPEYPERGPGSSWPDLPSWAALGFGSDGTPVPPWGFYPKNVGKRSLCYVPPIKGVCTGDEKDTQPEMRWGYNAYIDDCQKYLYSGCAGSRNRFVTQSACRKQCAELPPPSCSVNSHILDRTPKRG